jgi:hypothetical protein
MIMKIVAGTHANYYFEQLKTRGSLLRWSIPFFMNQIVVTSDYKLVKLVLEGSDDPKAFFEPLDRPHHHQMINRSTFGRPSMFTKKTHGEGWDWARKGNVVVISFPPGI